MSAVSAPTSAKPSIQQPAAHEEPSSWKVTLVKIGKVVLCALIPLVSLLIAHWIVPESWVAMVIPFVALCSIAVAVLGYKQLTALEAVSSPSSVVEEKPREPLPPGAPRGIVNRGNNCWVISLAQNLYADVGIREWLKSDECPEELQAFHDFMHAYDQAVADNAFVVTMKNGNGEKVDPAQELRKCFARMRTSQERTNRTGISSRNRQEDASEGWQKIYDLLPVHLKSAISITRHYYQGDDLSRPPVLNSVQHDCLAVAVSGKQVKMEGLMHCHFNACGEGDDPYRLGGVVYQPQKTVTRFVNAPPSLWIHFKRFNTVVKQIRTSEGIEYRPQTRKIKTAIEVPTNYNLPLIDKSSVPYKLRSVLVHHGVFGGGHYTSYSQAEDGQWYKLDDSSVMPISEEKLEEISQQAYMVQYSRVDQTDE